MSKPTTAGVGPAPVISRPSLNERLEGGAAGPVTVVAAPAGSGKTVLVRSWLKARESARPAAWVSVERGERDAQLFWGAVVDALRVAAPPGVNIEPVVPGPRFDGAKTVKRLVGELGTLTRRLVLVIDDLHEIASADILKELAYFLDRLPSAFHVVLITRRDPPLGLHRRQLAGELTQVRSAHLQFTLDETREMTSAHGIDLSEEALKLLHDRTEGWVAGLRLAVLSLATHPDPERFVAEFSGSERTVADYLLAEVLDSQPPEVRRLLVRTSLLSRVNGALGDLLTGSTGTERHLQALADAGGFIISLDAQRTWFRFHHLFADLLALELRHTDPDALVELHLTAARWYADHGYVIEAITHAQAAGDEDQAVGLLIEHYFGLTLDGRQATAHALLVGFSPDSIAAAPELATVIADHQLLEGSLEEAAAHLSLAERQADAVPEHRRHRFAMAHLVTRLSLARRVGDFQSVADAVQAAGVLAEPDTSFDIAMHNDVRVLMLMNLGIVEGWSGLFDQAQQHLEAAQKLAERIGRPYLAVSCRAYQAQAISWRSFTRGRQASREAIALAERHGWGEDPVIGQALVTLSACLLQAGRVDEAEEQLARARRLIRADLEPGLGFLIHLVEGGAHMARGRGSEAIESFRDAEDLEPVLVTGSPLRVQLGSAMLDARLSLGELAVVRDALADLTATERDRGEAREVSAALALAEGDAPTALTVLQPTLDGSAQVHHPVVAVRSLLRAASAHTLLSDSRASEDAVEQALDLAEQDSLILPFLHADSRSLLERHPRHRTAHGAFIAEILDVLSGKSLPGEVLAAPAALLEALSDAETRVLRFLPTNLSAAGIAGEIYVSVNTVKTHMRHLYAKLDAHSRVEAVQRARELGLLGHSARHL